MAHQLGSSTPMVPYVADHRYSSLHQERSYLLSALAAEESRAEHMSRSLETIIAKLKTAKAQEDSTDAVGNLRKAASALTRKLKKCQKSERAMANNLAAVTARMQMLEQHQWRKAQFEYSQRVQQMPVYGMPLAFQDLTLAPPISPAYGYPCHPYPPPSYTMSPLNLTFPSMPSTPMPQLQSTSSMDLGWNTPIPTPYHDRFQMPFGMSTPSNTPQPGLDGLWQPTGFQPSSQAVYNEPLKCSRRMSLPNPRTTSWHGSGHLTGIGEEILVSKSIELKKEPSLVDGRNEAERIQSESNECISCNE